MHLNDLLTHAVRSGASDIHIKVGSYPMMRIDGSLMVANESRRLERDDTETMAATVLNVEQRKYFVAHQEIDAAYSIPGLGRFRCNVFTQRGTISLVIRVISTKVPSVEALELPDVLRSIAEEERGLVLVTGTTGSGKSTTLAAMIDHINQHRSSHIVTVEDPIEYLHRDHRSIVNQREINVDTKSFAHALRSALRQDPDVILVGEMRDLETVETALLAAETGHLVFSTLHTNSSTQTVDRILDAFPPDQQNQVRAQVAQVLKGVVSMKLVERSDGQGLVAALEILKASPRLSQLIEKGETSALLEEVESSVAFYRMQSMNHSLLALLVHGVITYAEAMKESTDPEDLSLKLRKMFPGIEERGGEMKPSTADFSEILMLQQYRKLYEEQEEKTKMRVAEKDERIADLETAISARDAQMRDIDKRLQEGHQEMERMRGDYNRLRSEAQEKIDKLMDRIKELNNRLLGNGGGDDKKSGVFR